MKRLLSGITPSGDGTLHIGNYLGAVKQFVTLDADHECFLMVADLHALTTITDRERLAGNIRSLVLNELALLGETKHTVFFRQSDVPEHTELQSILNNVTPLGLIRRAHAYKDKLEKDVAEDDINLGLFNYPVLMAADILLYKADLVPVGRDQKQHIEITRDIAERFNRAFKANVFPLPEPFIRDDVAVVLGTDGQRKMSKSLGNIISIFEDEAVIRKQVMSCYTDPTRVKATDPGHVEGNMVFAYLDHFGNPEDVAAMKEAYIQGKLPDVEAKEYLYNMLMAHFGPARARYAELVANPERLSRILKDGATKARAVASKTIAEVRKATGIGTAFPAVPAATDEPAATISIESFAAVELRAGAVTEAVDVAKSDKLIRLSVDFGPLGVRTIFTGVRQYGYTAADFTGKRFYFVTNLAPRKMMGEESQGMIMAADGADGKPAFVSADGVPPGSRIR